MCFNFIISTAAKCSEVWGWGHDSLPAEININAMGLIKLSTNKEMHTINSFYSNVFSHACMKLSILYFKGLLVKISIN